MSLQHPFPRIIWAVDPFAEDIELQQKVLDTALTVGSRDFEIEPVSIVHWDERYFMGTVNDMVRVAKERVNALLLTRTRHRILPPTVLVLNEVALGRAVQKMIQHALTSKADLIAVGTLAKKGATRFLLGSFAESLVLNSPVPTLVVNPHTEPSIAFDKIIFPTDMSEISLSVFPQVVALAKLVGASINVFHRLEYIPAAGLQLIAPAILRPGILEDEIERRKREGKRFVAIADEAGVKAELVIQKDGKSTVDILTALSEDASSIIAMVSQTKKIESIILGSTTNQILRRSHCPVWVLHPSKSLKKGT